LEVGGIQKFCGKLNFKYGRFRLKNMEDYKNPHQ
jgi:hypothetical protein